MHHASRTVSDVDRALAFYRDLLGMQVAVDTDMAGEMLEREVALPGAQLRLVELRAGAVFLELLEYRAPTGAPLPADAKPADVGAHHIALLVDDIDAEYTRLEAAGVRFTWPPQEVDAGFFAGHRTAYCYDPDGLIVELWQLPSGGSRP